MWLAFRYGRVRGEGRWEEVKEKTTQAEKSGHPLCPGKFKWRKTQKVFKKRNLIFFFSSQQYNKIYYSTHCDNVEIWS